MPRELPDPESVAQMLTDLIFKKVTARPGSPVVVGPSAPGAVAVYDADGNIAAFCVCDMAFAAGSGAALSMIPPGQVEECVRTKALADNLAENFHEVVNVASRYFNHPDVPRVVLKSVVTSPDTVPADMASLIESAPSRLDLELEIEGYGKGRMSLVAL